MDKVDKGGSKGKTLIKIGDQLFSRFFWDLCLSQCGDVKDNDVVTEINEPSYIETREKVVPLKSTFQSTLLQNFKLDIIIFFGRVGFCKNSEFHYHMVFQ